jgi:hypothetical protein
MELPHTYEATEMDKRGDTAIDVVLEQLIEHGPEGNAAVFARNFEMAMRIKRERFLGAQRYERTADRRGYANGCSPSGSIRQRRQCTLDVPKTAGHDGQPFYLHSQKRGCRSVRAVMLAVAVPSTGRDPLPHPLREV